MPAPNPWDAASQARLNTRWAKSSAEWNTAMTEALLAAAELLPDSTVLDVAAGSGDPALTIAQRLTAGRVIAMDSSFSGLMLAQAQAGQLRLLPRLACIQADAHAIPLAPDSMDRITCRCGIMFFNDTAGVMAEMLRVLKPGGRGALLAWGPMQQGLFNATVAPVLRLVPGAEMPAAALTMFRFASPGALEGALRAAGFCNVHEELVTVPRIWRGTAEQLWLYQQEVSTLCHPLFAAIPAAVRPKVDAEVSSALGRFADDKDIKVPAKVIIASGMKA